MTEVVKLQQVVKTCAFGIWGAYPYALPKLLKHKILSHSEFIVFQYVFFELQRQNKFTAQFSKRHLANQLSISDRTAWNALAKLCKLGLLERAFEGRGYGEAYTFQQDVLRAILGVLESGAEFTPPLEKFTPPLEKFTPPLEKFTPLVVQNLHQTIDIYINLYSLYIQKLNDQQQKDFGTDCHRLINDGFTENQIMSFLELRSMECPENPLQGIRSFYAVVKAEGKDKLDFILSEMTAKRLRRDQERKEYAEMYERTLQSLKENHFKELENKN